jgi:hypothetical protein
VSLKKVITAMLMTAKDDATCVEREKFAEAFSPDKPIASPDSGLLSTLCCVRLETPETWQLRSVETWRHGDMETWRRRDSEIGQAVGTACGYEVLRGFAPQQ